MFNPGHNVHLEPLAATRAAVAQSGEAPGAGEAEGQDVFRSMIFQLQQQQMMQVRVCVCVCVCVGVSLCVVCWYC